MEVLSFGEQVKIILSRKNMTIKELAEQIQERTGKAMSRQNLTQRLGRDNFQEQDMRMIAAILDCPFRLSIFPADPAEDEKMMEYANASTQRKRSRRKKEEEDDGYQQTLVFDEEPLEDERDMTIGELYEIHEELKELEEEAAEEKVAHEESAANIATAEQVMEEPVVEETEEVSAEKRMAEEVAAEEVVPEAVVAEAAVEAAVAEEPMEEETRVEEPVVEEVKNEEKPVEEKKERFHTGGIFLRRMRRNDDVKKEENRKREEPKVVEKKPAREVITPDSEDFEPVIKHNDVEEDLTVGEMNPYTGREYQTNSVRMHPSRIGYVQVYDRKQHQWTDMTEWAFLGYQERKKALLGKDYEPPIYLD